MNDAAAYEGEALQTYENTLNDYRVVPKGGRDVLDMGGAAAALAFARDTYGEPLDHVAYVLSVRAALSSTYDKGYREQTGCRRPAALDEAHFEATYRVMAALCADATWAQHGLKTFDLTAGLYERLAHALMDPGFASLTLREVRFPAPALAIRFPGPNYPKAADGLQIRGVLLHRYEAARTRADNKGIQQALSAAAERAFGNAPEIMPEDYRRAVDEAIEATRHIETGPVVNAVMLGLDQTGGVLEHARAVLLTLRGVDGAHAGGVTLREAIMDALAAVPKEHDPEATSVEALVVALGTLVYLAEVPDEGTPVRTQPVRAKVTPEGAGRYTIEPDVRIIGRGLKGLVKHPEVK